MSDNYLNDIFNDHTGALAALIPNYAQRDSQVQLAQAIHNAIENEQVLLGHAPTGTGKSASYLVPAIYHAQRNNKKVLVVTANKALQEQLITKDLPTIKQAFAKADLPAFTFGLLKGRANYLCTRELEGFNAGSPLPGLDLENIDEAHALAAWASVTTTGDQADAPPSITQRIWNQFSVSGDRCTRNACPYKNKCFANDALSNAEDVQVLVINYDLFFSKTLHSANDTLWQKFQTVIFDECHEAPNVARRCFGSEFGVSHVNQLATDVSKFLGDPGLAKQLRNSASNFFEDVARYSLNNDKPRLHDENAFNILDIVDVLDDTMRAGKGNCGMCDAPALCGTCSMRARITERATVYIKLIQEFNQQSEEKTAYWIDKPSDDTRVTAGTVKLRAVPYRVGEHLSNWVFERYPAVICVSATMTSGGTFDFIREELGLVPSFGKMKSDGKPAVDWTFALSNAATEETNVVGIDVPSPFNYQTQAKFIVPLGIPFPIPENENAYNQACAKAVRQLIHDCKGRTLILCTSWRRVKFLANQLEGKIDYPLLVQGDAPNNMLIQMFREQTDSVLIATKSMWMGIDVQGESLSCLVIDKLPLESFSDPLVDMMKQKHPDTFWNDFYFPRAAIELAQGAGRLIRSVNDRGVFVLLDARILVKSYGNMMRRSLPFVGLSKDLADAGRFLATGK